MRENKEQVPKLKVCTDLQKQPLAAFVNPAGLHKPTKLASEFQALSFKEGFNNLS